MNEVEIDEGALTAAHIAVEDVLIELRDDRVSVISHANGFVIRERDGEMSATMRLGTRDGLRIGIEAYLQATREEAEERWMRREDQLCDQIIALKSERSELQVEIERLKQRISDMKAESLLAWTLMGDEPEGQP